MSGHAQELAKELAANGVVLLRTDDGRLHAKFLAWNDDNLVVTSFNWASASTDPDNPWNEIGVRINAQGIATAAMAALAKAFPELEAS
jgi:cardiolipin synthase A/B